MSRERVDSIATTVLVVPADFIKVSPALGLNHITHTHSHSRTHTRIHARKHTRTQTRHEDAERDDAVRRSIHRGCPLRFEWILISKRKKEGIKTSSSTHPKQTYRGRGCAWWGFLFSLFSFFSFTGAGAWIGCRYSLSPAAAAAPRFAPTTPTCFLSIKTHSSALSS